MALATLRIGAITIISLSDGSGSRLPTDLMPWVPAEAWEPLGEYLDANGHLQTNYGSFLIREGETWTLVDTGFGNRPGAGAGRSLASWRRPKSRRR